MSNNQGRIEWEYLETEEGQLKPGFQVSDSDIADFSIVSNSAGGVVAKDYAKQLQVILEGLTAAEMILVRAEVDSSETSGLPIALGCPHVSGSPNLFTGIYSMNTLELPLAVSGPPWTPGPCPATGLPSTLVNR